jgi:glycosyltransferase involved in cell wall biosynthesis
VLAALGAGRATVTTTLGAAGLDVGGPPPLLVADDGEAFAAAIRRLLADPELRRDLGRRGRAHVEAGYTPEAYADRVEASFDAALASRE